MDLDNFLTKERKPKVYENWLNYLKEINQRVNSSFDRLTGHLKQIKPGNVLIPVKRYLDEFREIRVPYVHHLWSCMWAGYKSEMVEGGRQYFLDVHDWFFTPFVISMSPDEAAFYFNFFKTGMKEIQTSGSLYYRNGVLTCDMNDILMGSKKSIEMDKKLRQLNCTTFLHGRGSDDPIADEGFGSMAGWGLVEWADTDRVRSELAKNGLYKYPGNIVVKVPKARQNLIHLEKPLFAYEVSIIKASLKDPRTLYRMRKVGMGIEERIKEAMETTEGEFHENVKEVLISFNNFLKTYEIDREHSFFPLKRSGIERIVENLISSRDIKLRKEHLEQLLSCVRKHTAESHMTGKHGQELKTLAEILDEHPDMGWGLPNISNTT